MVFKSNWAKNKKSDKDLFEYIGDMNNMPPILLNVFELVQTPIRLCR